MGGDLEYFRQRASEERTAALQARNLEARRKHIELAERYEDVVRALAALEQRAGIGSLDDPLRDASDVGKEAEGPASS